MWDLGIATNNQAKLWALWKGLDIATSKGIKKLKNLGDSMVIIRQISNVAPGRNSRFTSIVLKIAMQCKKINDISLSYS